VVKVLGKLEFKVVRITKLLKNIFLILFGIIKNNFKEFDENENGGRASN